MITFMLLMLIVLLIVALIFSIKKNLQQQERLEKITSEIEEALDLFDSSYQRFDKILRHDIMIDNPIVREAQAMMLNAKNTLLIVANKLISY